MELSELGKELLDLANENIKIGETHPLERYIIAIDLNWDDDSLLRSISERIGIYIPDEDKEASTTLFLKLREYLEQEKNFGGVERTRRLLNATPEEYPNSYANRLLSN